MKLLIRLIVLLSIITITSPSDIKGQNEFGGRVRFDRTIHDFGDIMISEGDKKCTFTLTNIGNKPIAIQSVITSCGCTDPTWTKKPIMPKEKGEISIVFKNDQGPYPFDKSITVYISDISKPIILRIKGVAHEKKKSLRELYPFAIGALGFREESKDAGYLEQGLALSDSFQVANISKKKISVEFINLDNGLTLAITPNPIAAGSKATLSYSIDSKKTTSPRWGNNTFTASIKVNGVTQQGKVRIQTMIKENFSGYTEEQRRNGSLPQLNTSSYTLGEYKSGEVKKFSFVCKNIGKEKLIFYKMESKEGGDAMSFDYPKEILPGKEGKIEVTINTSKLKKSDIYILTLITNSPVRPILSLFITTTN